MKVSECFSLMNIAGENVVLPMGEKNLDFKGIITLNNSGAFLWKQLEKDTTKKELLQAMLQEYEIDEVTAMTDLEKFLDILESSEVLK